MMKRTIVTVACLAGFLFSTTSAQASIPNIADAGVPGFVDSATPAGVVVPQRSTAFSNSALSQPENPFHPDDPPTPVDPHPVPDGGATLGLLGVAMLGLGVLRRRLK